MIIGDIKIEFPVRTIFDDTVQLILSIQTGDTYTAPTEYTPSNLGLSVANYGSLSMDFDLDDYIMTPANLTLVLNDEYKTLTGHLFLDDFSYMTLKAEIKVNSVSKFNGSLIHDSLNYSSSKKQLSLTFSSDSNKINEVTLYNEQDVALNPLGVNIDGYSRISNNREATATFPNALLKILQLVDSNISLTVTHDWEFRSLLLTELPSINYLYVDYKWWFNDSANDRLLGDLLRSIAKTFSSQIVIPNNSEAYFRKLFYYSSSNLQEVTVLDHSQTYKYHQIKYTVGKNLSSSSVYHFPSEDDYTEVTEDVLSFTQNNDVYYLEEDTALRLESIGYAKDPLWANETQSWFYFMELVPKVAHYYRSKKKYTRVDSFKLKGLDYSYTKNFNYDGNKYQILSMTRNLSNGVTDIEALYLGEV